MKEVPVVRPLTDRRIPGTVGTAFDYRLLYYLALTPVEDLVAVTGMRLLDAGSEGARGCGRFRTPSSSLTDRGPLTPSR